MFTTTWKIPLKMDIRSRWNDPSNIKNLLLIDISIQVNWLFIFKTFKFSKRIFMIVSTTNESTWVQCTMRRGCLKSLGSCMAFKIEKNPWINCLDRIWHKLLHFFIYCCDQFMEIFFSLQINRLIIQYSNWYPRRQMVI